MSRWRPGSNKKTIALREHAKRRALKRYGLVLTSADLKQIVDDIEAERGTCLGTSSLTRSTWAVEVKGKVCHVVYNKQRKVIVTFLNINPMTEQRKGEPNEHDQRNAAT